MGTFAPQSMVSLVFVWLFPRIDFGMPKKISVFFFFYFLTFLLWADGTPHIVISFVHLVTTKDGYILTVFRIQSPSVASGTDHHNRARPVALLWHGLLDSAYTWLYLGKSALPYQLADAGYDVYLGNNRGNYFSTK
jgi:hypothetical protein